jgi:imidazolonepropionase
MPERQRAELILAAQQVVTCAGGTSAPKNKQAAQEIGLVSQGAVVIADGLIVEVGPQAEIDARWMGDRLELPGTCLIPGLVDPHCHPLWAGDRKHEFALRARGASYEEIHAAGGGIAHTVHATRQASDAELLERACTLVERMLAHGTTTLEAKSGYGLAPEEELRQLRLIAEIGRRLPVDVVPTCLGAHAVPLEYEQDRQGFLATVTDQLLPAVKAQGLARYADVFCERGAFTRDESELVLRKARELGLGLRIHAEEFSYLGGSRMAAELGATTCDHLQHLPAEDFPVLKACGTIPVVIPGTSFFLDLDVYAPARALWDAGLPVALGTDFNAGSCWLESMQMAMSLAVLKMKMTPEEALTAATINAAHSLGMADRVGSLEAGKQADVLVLDSPDFRDAIYRFGGNQVRAVIKNGVVLNTILRSPLGAPL